MSHYAIACITTSLKGKQATPFNICASFLTESVRLHVLYCAPRSYGTPLPNQKLRNLPLVTKGIATRSKDASGSWAYYYEQEATRSKGTATSNKDAISGSWHRY